MWHRQLGGESWGEAGVFPLLPMPAQQCMGMGLGLEGPVLPRGTRGPLSAAPLLSYLDREAFYSRGGCRVVKTVMPPSACVPRRQQQVSGTCGAGVILAQWGRRLGEQILALKQEKSR